MCVDLCTAHDPHMNRIARLSLVAAATTAIGAAALSLDGTASAGGARTSTVLRDATGATLGARRSLTGSGHTEVTIWLSACPPMRSSTPSTASTSTPTT